MLKTAFHHGGPPSNLQSPEEKDSESECDRQGTALLAEKSAPKERLDVLTANPTEHKGPLDLTDLLDSLKVQGGATPGTINRSSMHGDGARPRPLPRTEALEMLSRQSYHASSNSAALKESTSQPKQPVRNGNLGRKTTTQTIPGEHLNSQDHSRACSGVETESSQQYANSTSDAAFDAQLLDFEELLLGRLSELQIAADRQLVQLRRAQLRAPRILQARQPRDSQCSRTESAKTTATPACTAVSELQKVVEKRLDALQQTLLRQQSETERLLAQLDHNQ